MSAEFQAGLAAQRNGVDWWNNPHPGGSVAAYEWDKGHSAGRPRARFGNYTKTSLDVTAPIRIGNLEFGPVEKRSNCWGWFVTVDHCQPRFIAYGSVRTKKDAIDRREADMEKARNT